MSADNQNYSSTSKWPSHADYARRHRAELRPAPLPPTGENDLPVLETEDRCLRVRFDPGFGLNVHIEMWAAPNATWRGSPKEWVMVQDLGMSIGGWDSLVELVHQYDRWVEETK